MEGKRNIKVVYVKNPVRVCHVKQTIGFNLSAHFLFKIFLFFLKNAYLRATTTLSNTPSLLF